ncbi:sigma 54-interacting transcriptional regulator [Pontibacillus salicampi]|uniref:Sigma 54-interacting transcriptional regulator n=1 Tax=Pontibacillus salicampi TaxID=1449801 RepID=A0ABV6LQI4_9BACI
MKSKHLITYNFIKVTEEASVREVLQAFLDYRQDIACVLREKKLVGIISKYSLYRWLLQNGSLDENVWHCVKQEVVTLYEEDSVYYAKDLLVKENVGHAVVLNTKDEVIGIMSKSELIRGLITERNNVVHRLQSLMNNLQESVLSVDENLIVTSYNTSSLQLLHKDQQELIHHSIEELYPQMVPPLLQVIQHQKIVQHCRIEIGETTAIASFIPLKEWGNITGAMMVLKDITEFEHIAAELETTKQLENLLDNALEMAYDGVVLTNNKGEITKVNNEFLSLIQRDAQSILGQPLPEIVPELTPFSKNHSSQEIVGEIVTINETKAILTQMPIYQGQQKVGTIIKLICKQLDMWKDLLMHLENLESELTFYKENFSTLRSQHGPFSRMISRSTIMDELKQKAVIAAKTPSNILITGKSGTGKELLADGIHTASERKGACIKINCAAIPEDLLESELFGYEEGAFTGAKKGGKPGKFELAHQGTLFLDEIGDMPLPLQAKLLRVLQQREFERVGGTKPVQVDVRLIAATNKHPAELIDQGSFREDLYYRINVIQLHIPSLSERKEDIPLLCDHFIHQLNELHNRDMIGIAREDMELLLDYHWPGNVRQLENVVERAYHFSPSRWIDKEHILLDKPQSVGTATKYISSSSTMNRERVLGETEKNMLLEALEKTNGNRTQAASLLGMSRSTFYNKLKKYHVHETTRFV